MSLQNGNLNLTMHRASGDVWSRADALARRQAALSAFIGVISGVLAVRAATDRHWRGALVAGLATGVAVFVVACPGRMQAMRQRLTIAAAGRTTGRDAIEDASKASFPASDAPSWTPAVLQ